MPTVVKQDERNFSFFWSRIIFDALKKTLRKGKFWQERKKILNIIKLKRTTEICKCPKLNDVFKYFNSQSNQSHALKQN